MLNIRWNSYVLNKKTPFETRTKILALLWEEIDSRNEGIIHLVRTDHITSLAKLDACYKEYLEENYEGQMGRSADGLYENKRSWGLLKRKIFKDAELTLEKLESGLGNWNGCAKSATLRLPDGRTFKAGITGTKEFCRQLLLNEAEYVSKPTTVNFFQYTPDGIPLFGRCKEFDRSDI